ncbi:50S ribosomal protein L4 [Patescibacteria group bacterium]|nr:50S ribosomal protein L4 [Patescibacteria group bacterium]
MKELNAKTINMQGEKVGEIKLPAEIFGLEIKHDLIYQAVISQKSSNRIPYAHTKDRSEVRGGGRKPWRQKGTGRARHGSTRSPIWIGGGVTFGPRNERNFDKKINKKAKRKALLMVFSSKFRDKELIVVDKLELEKGKTKTIDLFIKKIIKKPNALIISSNKNVIRASKNLPYLKTIGINSLNVIDLLSFKYLILSQESIKKIKETYVSSI